MTPGSPPGTGVPEPQTNMTIGAGQFEIIAKVGETVDPCQTIVRGLGFAELRDEWVVGGGIEAEVCNGETSIVAAEQTDTTWRQQPFTKKSCHFALPCCGRHDPSLVDGFLA